jgi:hypothetical protein
MNDDEPNPIENGLQQAYYDIRSSLELILGAELGTLDAKTTSILNSLDDAISNNWDDFMLCFWRGVRQDINLLTEEDAP